MDFIFLYTPSFIVMFNNNMTIQNHYFSKTVFLRIGFDYLVLMNKAHSCKSVSCFVDDRHIPPFFVCSFFILFLTWQIAYSYSLNHIKTMIHTRHIIIIYISCHGFSSVFGLLLFRFFGCIIRTLLIRMLFARSFFS